MKKNIGGADRLVRVIAAVVLAGLILTGVVGGAIAWILGVAGIVLLLTSSISFCPLYLPLKICTKRTDVANERA